MQPALKASVRLFSAIALTSFAGIIFSPSTFAQEQASSRRISMIVASGPGGGYDIYSRTLARYYGKHLPGNPAIAVQNMPGGGGNVAANYLYNIAPRDGSAIGMLQSVSFLVAALGDKSAQFVNSKFSLIGNMNEETDTCLLWHTSKIADAKAFLTEEVIIGGAGLGSTSVSFPMGMNNILSSKLKIIPGYHGAANERVIAMERGELQGACGVFLSTVKSQLAGQLRDGKIRIVLQMGLSRHPDLADVPNALEFATSGLGKSALEFLFAQLAFGRPILAPPGVPSQWLSAAQAGFDKTMQDPEFLTEAKKLNLETRWFGAARMADVMGRIDSVDEAVKATVRTLLNIQ
jgi:tripartite-type tricarboxylate transporter receptor subunit TctC